MSEIDAVARKRGWLVLVPGEAYERSLAERRALYVYALDDGRWEAVYHSQGEYGERLRVLVQTSDWRRAFQEASRFEDWLKTKARRRSGRTGDESPGRSSAGVQPGAGHDGKRPLGGCGRGEGQVARGVGNGERRE